MDMIPICEFVWCILIVTISALQTDSVLLEKIGTGPVAEFSRASVFKPRIYHGRDKREISSTRVDQEGLEHIHDLTVALDMNGRNQLLDLRLNRELIPKEYFEKHQKNGSYVIRRPGEKEVELCHYQGKLRGLPESWAAVSTCHGLRGVVFDGSELHYIERATGSPHIHEVNHYLYSHSNLVSNLTCGYQGTDHSHKDDFYEINRLSKRMKRSDEVIRGPYNANAQSKYVELVLVMDNKEYKALGESMDRVNNHCKDIANIINALYVPLNIFIALVGVVVWTEYDEIALSPNGDTTLTNFLHYRREKLVNEHPNDNAQLLTRTQFEGGVVGKALKGPICTFEFSGGVSMDHSAVVGLVATTVAHEMGHNFGMEHDSVECHCPDDRCIMAPSSSSMSPTHWSSCSLEYLALAFEHGMDYCLRNKPTKLFDSPVCGNGFVEAGEQCDCGLKHHCSNPCCDTNTCMLFSNASCATGECCDLKTCRPKTVGTLCREANQECDLAEYCTGHSEFCPDDVFKMYGSVCNRGKAYCYNGSCRTHTDQCKLLWGPSGKSSDTQCYKMNKKGSRHGNCGYNRINQSYIKCQDQDLQCGMLHCTHLNERLEFGMESVAILSHSFINSQGSIIPCRTAIVDLGLNQVDPGLAPDGAKCGDGKMCVNRKCMSVENMWAADNVAQCPGNNCNGHGVCNSRGHCHCDAGFSPPYCDYPGPGGSEDSGPASDPNARREFVIFLYVTFLVIVPSIALVSLFVYYMKRNPMFWRKKPRIVNIDKKLSSPGGRSTGPMVPDTSRATLLPTTDPFAPSAPVEGSNLQNNLVGQYKGFSIVPLPKPTAPSSLTPTRAAPVVAPTSVHRVSPPKIPTNTINQHLIPYPVRPAPKVPPTSVGLAVNNNSSSSSVSVLPDNLPPQRPNISSPVLDTTTSFTAKELIDDVPLRPAPSVPPQVRPVSSPVSNYVGLETKVVKPKDAGYPTLTRIASFMSRSNKGSQDVKKETNKSGKIDRDSLKSLQISNPILQKEISVPASSLPAGEKAVVMRAQSLRSTVPDKRPPIPSFGSMRLAGSKRPTSIPAGNRPSSPPPPRPPSIGLPGYQTPGKMDNTYDDCLNLLTEGVAPLANIDEESPSATDNIYAIIEESPTDRRERKEIVLPKKLEYTSPTGEYKSPKPIESSVSAGSAESMGLLGEIVSEIQARNTDSIYSTSTLNRKREREKEKDDDETASTVTDMSSEIDKNQMYVNTPWKGGYTNVTVPSKSSSSSTTSSSGYLSPINPNLGNKPNDITQTESVKVPDSTAPYKPYLQRNFGPIVSASLTTKPSTNSKPSASENNRSNISGISETKNETMKTNAQVKQITQPNNRLVTNSKSIVRRNSEGLSSVKPDLVSSCSPSSVKSPDVLGGKGDMKTPTSGNVGTISTKQVISKPGPSFRGGRQPLPAPKPAVIPTSKASITSQPLPAIPVGNKSKPVVSKFMNAKSDSNETDLKSGTVNKPSSVASLQQKFELNKQVKPSNLTKGTIAKNNVNSLKSSNIKR